MLQNLRFAADVLVIGESLSEVEDMLNDLSADAVPSSLELHPKKTKY